MQKRKGTAPWESATVREDTCPEPSVLRSRVVGSFPHSFRLPTVATGSPSTAGWAMSKRPNLVCLDLRVFRAIDESTNNSVMCSFVVK